MLLLLVPERLSDRAAAVWAAVAPAPAEDGRRGISRDAAPVRRMSRRILSILPPSEDFRVSTGLTGSPSTISRNCPLDTTSAGFTDNRLLGSIFGNWQWSGDLTVASGLPFTPRILGQFHRVSRGTNGTLRPNVVPGQPIALPNPSIGEWFNTAAFVNLLPEPVWRRTPEQHHRPGQASLRYGNNEDLPLKEARVLEFRAQATNIFNMPQYSTIDTVVTRPPLGVSLQSAPCGESR